MPDTPISFARVRAGLAPAGDGFSCQVPAVWRQGRTAYGGVTAGLAVAVAHKAIDDLPPLRSMIANFTGPIIGDPRFVPTSLRRGKSVTTVQVTVYSDDAVAAQLVFSFGGSRETGIVVPGGTNPLDHPPAHYDDFVPESARSLAPRFVTNFENRLVAGNRPGDGAQQGYMRTVARHRDVDSRAGIDCFVALADILPPAAILLVTMPAPVSTVSWMLNLLTDDLVTNDGWWQFDARLTAAGDGYSSQQMRAWSLDGTLVATAMQSIVQFC